MVAVVMGAILLQLKDSTFPPEVWLIIKLTIGLVVFVFLIDATINLVNALRRRVG